MTDTNLLRIGSRASPLARVQAEWVAERVAGCTAMVWVKSGGDADRTTDLRAFGNTGIFTAELNQALLEDRVDVAVHSLKDLPAADEGGLVLGCVPTREDVHDALIARDGMRFEDLPAGSRVGTGSPRRIAQLQRARPDLTYMPIRGNVDTRLAHVRDGRADAVVLAMAGLRRLSKEDAVTDVLDPSICLPAAGQGALGIVIREGDARASESLESLRDIRAAACVTAERAALHALGAGCHTPVGALATVEDGRLELRVRVLAVDGSEALEDRREGALAEAHAIGTELAATLLERGAKRLVDAS
ncbi:MAG: hydroxymethylbilane synthase [Planctomycetota bacterium]|nr:hydroxymethylbilane synthase [Planctomycetota bacterium]